MKNKETMKNASSKENVVPLTPPSRNVFSRIFIFFRATIHYPIVSFLHHYFPPISSALIAICSTPSSVSFPPMKPLAWTKTPPGTPETAESSASRTPRQASGSASRDWKLCSATDTAWMRHLPLLPSGYSTYLTCPSVPAARSRSYRCDFQGAKEVNFTISPEGCTAARASIASCTRARAGHQPSASPSTASANSAPVRATAVLKRSPRASAM
mmetsp:Transcript_8507/g.12995  ORF Transcript_8507/g.12995 Transcript_8507/m.12995 type:complete len:213 (+) Transcript_8507:114-752(+)